MVKVMSFLIFVLVVASAPAISIAGDRFGPNANEDCGCPGKFVVDGLNAINTGPVNVAIDLHDLNGFKDDMKLLGIGAAVQDAGDQALSFNTGPVKVRLDAYRIGNFQPQKIELTGIGALTTGSGSGH